MNVKKAIILITCLSILICAGIFIKDKTSIDVEAESNKIIECSVDSQRSIVSCSMNQIVVSGIKLNEEGDAALSGATTPSTTPSTPVVSDSGVVYLTFDDGPNEYTPRILDILKERGIHATFYVNGYPEYEYIYMRIIKEGHTLGNHAWTHDYKTIYSNSAGFIADVTKMDKYLKDLGYTTKLFRFPGGSNNTVCKKYGAPNVMAENIKWIKSQGYFYLDWNVSSTDASSKDVTAATIHDSTMNNIKKKNSALVLMHSKKATSEALPGILDEMIAQGKTFKVLEPEPTSDDSPVMRIKFTK